MGREFDLVDALMRYEDGEMTQEETVELFQAMINTGMVWQLQGTYQRTANDLIQAGLCHLPEQEHEGAR